MILLEIVCIIDLFLILAIFMNKRHFYSLGKSIVNSNKISIYLYTSLKTSKSKYNADYLKLTYKQC